MSTYVLIHGAYHGGWCWDKVVPLLEREGHKVEAPDLPGHGNDRTPIPEISLQAYANRVCATLDAQSEPAILVGHSMGGAVITQAAEYRPDRIRKLVYLAAILPQNGETALQWGTADRDTLLRPYMVIAVDRTYSTVREDGLKEVFYGDCSDEDVERAKSLLIPDATAPALAPVNTTPDNFGRIPRIYISCNRDRAISPPIQERMYNNLPCAKVIKMDTSHSPFFSAPEELAGFLLSLSD
ncbi:MAG: alpha/beta fold hydrolase [Chloroflexota bacterium]|nr:alpha/beta fold hydrolase [Chloroflexota bacterium]